MQGKIKVDLQTSGGSYTKIFRKNKKKTDQVNIY